MLLFTNRKHDLVTVIIMIIMIIIIIAIILKMMIQLLTMMPIRRGLTDYDG